MSRAIQALHSLKSCLENLQAEGRTHLAVSGEAVRILEALPARLRPRAAPPARRTEAMDETAEAVAILAASAAGAKATVTGSGIVPVGATAAEKIASLRKLAENWEPARALGTLRDTMVFSAGHPAADLMLVGEAPGADEERRREPFVGRAGEKLTQILKAMGFERGQVYISNICKFRPAMEDQGTGNRKPTPVEMECCLPFVLAEISVVRPKVIVALGGTAAEGLLGMQQPVGRMRSRFHDRDGTPVMVTYHPSYLLRNEDLAERRKVWEDMLMVMERLQMPISPKQREYFLK